MNIVVLDGFTLNPGDNPWDAIAGLGKLVVHERTPDDRIIERSRDATILLTNKTPLSADTIAQLPELRFIGVLATGYNVVDVVAARQRGIPVSNVPVYATHAVAQHVFSLLLALIHKPTPHDRAIRDGQWRERGDFCFWLSPLTELHGKTFGIIGFGRIGRAVGRLARAFGMHVLAYDVAHEDSALPEGVTRMETIEEICRHSDVISLHCPQTSDNTGFVNASLLSAMKPTAYFINTARGGLVNEQDLADALKNERLAGAALDVVSIEPITDDNLLLAAPNCILTPHIAWAAREARIRLMAGTAENIKAFQSGNPINVVN
jgi:glycerate dehydrogenase